MQMQATRVMVRMMVIFVLKPSLLITPPYLWKMQIVYYIGFLANSWKSCVGKMATTYIYKRVRKKCKC